ncbi:MAG: S41 family peptidase [Polyangiaceae bacterium]
MSLRPLRPLFTGALAATTLALAALPASAADFGPAGELVPDKGAVTFIDFETDPPRYVPDDTPEKCQSPGFAVAAAPDALDGEHVAVVNVVSDCAERFLFTLPKSKGSYRVSAWVRHGKAGLSVLVLYPPESGLSRTLTPLGPTGRATSDGWVEMASNEIPIDASAATAAYLRVVNFGGEDGTELDSIEVVPAGQYEEQKACAGAFDPVCGSDAVCVHGLCAPGRLAVPPLPTDALRDEVVDGFAGRIRTYFGGVRSRAERLPEALATIDSTRKAKTAWQFWGGLSRAVSQLADWHTSMYVPLGGDPRYRLNACFIEGDADTSHALWPKHPLYSDILVSHAGDKGAADLRAGDRLVAVDGQHPLAWARSLRDVNPGHHSATDPSVFAESAEALGGPFWGGALIIKYAKTVTVVRCDAKAGTCADKVETLQVKDLTEPGGEDVICDNRPFYHFEPDKNPPSNHAVFYNFYSGKIAGTTDEEAIYGVVWDTLYGGGQPNGYVNGNLKTLMKLWKESARGVILDHRAGNGGTLDAPEVVTTLVRPPETLAVVLMPTEIAGFGGPATPEEGILFFDQFKAKTPYQVGSVDHDPELPVALIIHRDGSASDYLPLGMKGAPKARIFGPHPTAGAFSTFVNMAYYGAFEIQLASGDTVTSDGKAWIGHGVEPDFVVPQRQSDLLAGKDSLHEAALAWIRDNLKDAGGAP